MDNCESLPSVTRQAISVNQLRHITEQAHISFIYQPILNNKFSETDIVEISKYYNMLLKPILMIYRSVRSSVLFNEAKKLGLLNE
ncbi:hypothetical protein E0H89_16080 [Acinetobacter sp. ANC 3781]|jgi:protein tyrosine phosphatase (PTP) superfamily phosphohydrolase (DUF442 family)|uniref:hypothetical protein n=1 Tax=Acinetobacter sp. ANC 3781 TaxID=2529835 RepID=UPI00103FA31A|nr:hypothetical protein [Acinetobacter sp. ANC 3781]TCB70386.1 hypothetical protein E0H89_16080 [Acinetobacter sp. ANC 3781]